VPTSTSLKCLPAHLEYAVLFFLARPRFGCLLAYRFSHGDANEVYIEAVDGERFIIVVDFLNNFDIKGGSHLRIQYHMEQARGKTSRALYACLPSLHAKAQGEHDAVGREVLDEMDMKVRGAWSRCGFVFAPLQTGRKSLS
jgi:hypothetical protein